VNAERIKALIEAGLPGAEVEVRGEDGRHFEALVRSPAFAGKSLLAQHRMVYAALGEHMADAIHALSLRTEAAADS
jgi:acid stress-induced BolA-like protein IbaG/YrbA